MADEEPRDVVVIGGVIVCGQDEARKWQRFDRTVDTDQVVDFNREDLENAPMGTGKAGMVPRSFCTVGFNPKALRGKLEWAINYTESAKNWRLCLDGTPAVSVAEIEQFPTSDTFYTSGVWTPQPLLSLDTLGKGILTQVAAFYAPAKNEDNKRENHRFRMMVFGGIFPRDVTDEQIKKAMNRMPSLALWKEQAKHSVTRWELRKLKEVSKQQPQQTVQGHDEAGSNVDEAELANLRSEVERLEGELEKVEFNVDHRTLFNLCLFYLERGRNRKVEQVHVRTTEATQALAAFNIDPVSASALFPPNLIYGHILDVFCYFILTEEEGMLPLQRFLPWFKPNGSYDHLKYKHLKQTYEAMQASGASNNPMAPIDNFEGNRPGSKRTSDTQLRPASKSRKLSPDAREQARREKEALAWGDDL